MAAKNSLVGRIFTRLIVIESLPSRREPCGTMSGWSRCICSCGTVFETRNQHLKNGHTKSCRCLCRELAKKANTTHGHCSNGTQTRTHSIWNAMKQRCGNSTISAWSRYGGKGIKVCERWMEYKNFLEDMGECPLGQTIDRIDNSKGYSPENCRWATRKEQARNTSRNRIATINGITACLPELCERFAMSISMVRQRIYTLGWSLEKAILTPKRSCKEVNAKLK